MRNKDIPYNLNEIDSSKLAKIIADNDKKDGGIIVLVKDNKIVGQFIEIGNSKENKRYYDFYTGKELLNYSLK